MVSVCTPPVSHVPLIEAAARAGKHVLVEKPLALTLAEADRAIHACTRAGVQLGVAHQQRARSATMALQAMIGAGAFGEALVAAAVHGWHRPAKERARDAWRGQRGAGGNLLFDQAVHAIDLLVWFLGAPTWAAGSSAGDADIEDAETVVATIGFEGGALAVLAASTAANRMRDDIAIDFAGSRGGFRLEIRDYDNAEITALDLAVQTGRARRLSSDEVEALIRQYGGAWRAGPRAPLLRLLARTVGGERGAHPFRSPRALLRRRLDRIAADGDRRAAGPCPIARADGRGGAWHRRSAGLGRAGANGARGHRCHPALARGRRAAGRARARRRAVRVVHLIDHLSLGGSQALLLDLLECRGPGIEPEVWTLRDRTLPGTAQRLRCGDVRLRCLDMSGGNPLRLHALRAWLARTRPALLHTHLDVSNTFGVAAALTLGKARPRIVCHIENDPGLHYGCATRWLLPRVAARVDAGIVLSQSLRAATQPFLRGMPLVVVIPPGIDLGRFDPAAADAATVRQLRGSARRMVGTVARLAGQKGIETSARRRPATARGRVRHPRAGGG